MLLDARLGAHLAHFLQNPGRDRRVIAQLPQVLTYRHHGIVVGTARNVQMEFFVRHLGSGLGSVLGNHFLQYLLQLGDLFIAHLASGQACGLTLEHDARLQNLKRTDIGIASIEGTGFGVHDIYAGTTLDLDTAGQLEGDDRLPYRRPADLEALRQLALCGQTRARRVIARGNRSGQLLRHLLVQSRTLHAEVLH